MILDANGNFLGARGDTPDAIRGAMRRVLEYVTSTASAVEEQSAVAGDMSANTQRAAEQANRMGRAG